MRLPDTLIPSYKGTGVNYEYFLSLSLQRGKRATESVKVGFRVVSYSLANKHGSSLLPQSFFSPYFKIDSSHILSSFPLHSFPLHNTHKINEDKANKFNEKKSLQFQKMNTLKKEGEKEERGNYGKEKGEKEKVDKETKEAVFIDFSEFSPFSRLWSQFLSQKHLQANNEIKKLASTAKLVRRISALRHFYRTSQKKSLYRFFCFIYSFTHFPFPLFSKLNFWLLKKKRALK